MADDPVRERAPLHVTVRNAVLHMAGDQPLVADLFGMPGPSDTGLLCTNLRTLAGKRPVFVDDSRSTFFFPYAQIRFIEVLPPRGGPALLEAPAGTPASAEPEADLEIDEAFLKRVRDV